MFQGKRVLVVDMGNSGVDIAVEASCIAAKAQPPQVFREGNAGGNS